MTPAQLYTLAAEFDPNFGDTHMRIGQNLSMELRACEAIHAGGGAAAFSGDVDSPTGYFYRIDRWIVIVDTRGFLDIETYETEDEASKAYGVRDDEYSAWDNDFVEL